ncbi:hypothetical protein [Microbacterium sp.]|uniref:hypothetical protein n=1 Tax=Microbacterium sp. TaxID=51671 RepID=UPI002811560F|nr:hypothetical protein [Microbacterium sp.]
MHQGDAAIGPTSGISRRSFVQGAAWSVPVVAAAVAMPQVSAIPANALRSGMNVLPVAWKLTPTAISYPGPFGRTGYDFTTTVTYEGQTVFSSYAQGNLADSTEPVQLEANDIYG